jgi:hypothetical protein
MKLSQWITAILVVGVLGMSMMNPGGWPYAFGIAVLLLIGYGLLEFLPEYLLVVNQGKNARKDKRRRRRARGLLPFTGKSKRQQNTRQQSTQQDGGRDE